MTDNAGAAEEDDRQQQQENQKNDCRPLTLPALIPPPSQRLAWTTLFTTLWTGQWIDQTPSKRRVVCYEMSYPQRVQAAREWIVEDKLKFWDWRLGKNSYRIAYTRLEPERGGDSPANAPLESTLPSTPPTALLIHGFSSNRYCWRFLAPYLVKHHHLRVWAIDFLGSGKSDSPVHINYEPRLFIQQIEEFMAAHGIDKAHVFGHSMGAAISMALAIKLPDKVVSLTLIAPLLYPIRLSPWYEWIRIFGWMLPFFNEKIVKAIMRKKLVFYDPKDMHASVWSELDLDEYLNPVFKPGGWHSMLSLLNNFSNAKLEVLTRHYNEVKVPILAIHGNRDDTIPCFGCFQLQHACPQAEVHILDKTGHLVLEERPRTIDGLVGKFMGRVLGEKEEKAGNGIPSSSSPPLPHGSTTSE